jgi:hypothetical protein
LIPKPSASENETDRMTQTDRDARVSAHLSTRNDITEDGLILIHQHRACQNNNTKLGVKAQQVDKTPNQQMD